MLVKQFSLLKVSSGGGSVLVLREVCECVCDGGVGGGGGHLCYSGNIINKRRSSLKMNWQPASMFKMFCVHWQGSYAYTPHRLKPVTPSIRWYGRKRDRAHTYFKLFAGHQDFCVGDDGRG